MLDYFIYLCTVREVHLEIIRNFSSKCLILAIRRFIARRGKPALFVSDNLKFVKCADVKEFILKHQIKWEFILRDPPGGIDFTSVSLVSLNLRLRNSLVRQKYMLKCVPLYLKSKVT